MVTQCDKILERLQQGSVTNIELNRDICFRYGARIMDLREQGYNIKSKHIKGSIWEFSLITEPVQMSLEEVLV